MHAASESMKLSGNPLEDKYRGFGTVSPPINMEFDQLGLQIRPRGGHGEVGGRLAGSGRVGLWQGLWGCKRWLLVLQRSGALGWGWPGLSMKG